MALETEILHSLPSLALIPPERLRVPVGMARSQFRAMGTTISFLLPEEDLQRGEAIVRSLFSEWEQILESLSARE